VLNVNGETWWDQRASDRATPPSRRSDSFCTVVTDADQLAAAVNRLRRYSRIGLDVETEMYSQRLCLVQLAGENETFLVDVLTLTDLEPLRAILESPAITKIIHNAAFESRILGAHGIQIRGIYDTLKVSRDRRGRKLAGGHGLAAVSLRELGEVMSKEQQTSNWKRRPLSRAQLDYAALDAEVLLRLHDAFESDKQSGRLL
jgi:ribonuclease D